MSHPAVVRIFATTQEPDYDSPWQSNSPSSSTGSGVAIGGGRILTGAHVVAHATFLQVQKLAAPDKEVAYIKAICHDCDLALLEVEDASFFDHIEIPSLGDLPDLRDRVSVLGYPVGGEEISITEGVVSRIEVQRYSHSQRSLLAVTVDAAINSGNSGGPVFKDDKVVGIAFQSLRDAENAGEMVPVTLIRRFLEGVANDREIGVPALGLFSQNLENPVLRKKLGIDDSLSGVLVTAIDYGSSASGILQTGDTICKIDGLPIANNGTVSYRNKHRTRYSVALNERFIGDVIPLQIFRDGKLLDVDVPLRAPAYLVERYRYDQPPGYFVYGGLVFQNLTRDYLTTWDNWWDEAPKEFLHLYYSGLSTEAAQEVVILTQILADKCNVGYEGLYNQSITAVDGRQPRNLRHFVDLVESAKGIVEIRTSDHGIVVLDKKEIAKSNKRILERYHIQHDRSEDLKA